MNKEFEIRYTRGSGPGGQHRNKVETCVIITHIPTGLQEKCEDTRYKNRNLQIAKKRLGAKIKEHETRLIREKTNAIRKELIQNNKTVKTYNYQRNTVYDHRTKVKADLKKVMNGELDLLR